jgi:tetratricopeptide (TPR) repeat protein
VTSTHRIGASFFLFLMLLLPGMPARGENGSGLLKDGIDAFRRGYLTWDLASLTRAATSFQKACAIHCGSPETHYWLGVARFHILLHRRSDSKQDLTTPEFKTLARAVEAPLKEVIRLDKANAESHAILGTVTGMEIARGTRSRFWGGRSLTKHQRLAVEYGENNPRVQYLLGVSTIQGREDPESAKKGLPILLKAESLFARERNADRPPLQPCWGYDHCLVFIGRAYRCLGDPDTAKEYFEKALKVNPSSQLAERELQSSER